MATGTDRPDHVRDLNNYLQEVQQGENLTRYLSFSNTSQQTGETNQVVHTGTYTFRGVNIGNGQGTNKATARSLAAKQGLEFLKANGIPPPVDSNDG